MGSRLREHRPDRAETCLQRAAGGLTAACVVAMIQQVGRYVSPSFLELPHMIKAVDLRKGRTIVHEGELSVVHEATHVAKGNKRSYMQVKLKNFKMLVSQPYITP